MTSFDNIIDRTWSENRLFAVLLELTYRCNLDCFFCYNDLGLRGTTLTFAEYETLLRDLASMNVLQLALTGGEPLAHPDFFRIGALARQLGFVVRVKTNGHAVRGELARRLRDEVDPFVVEVSLHGACAETHDKQTRVAGSFERLVTNIREMLVLGLRVKVNSTLTRWNENEVAAMYAITDSLGVPLRFDLQVSPRDDGDLDPMSISATSAGITNLMHIDDARGRGAASAQQPAVDDDMPRPAGKHCGAGSAGIAVDPYGNVYPCVQWRRPVANLHEQSIIDVWGGSEVLDEIRRTTVDVHGVVARHPRGKLLNFCPGLAESLSGSPTIVPDEMERKARIIEEATRATS